MEDFILSDEDRDAILQEIKYPRIPNDKLKKAFEYYQEAFLYQNEVVETLK